jgi:hypothetical protein
VATSLDLETALKLIQLWSGDSGSRHRNDAKFSKNVLLPTRVLDIDGKNGNGEAIINLKETSEAEIGVYMTLSIAGDQKSSSQRPSEPIPKDRR